MESFAAEDIQKIERLIHISETRAIDISSYIPWDVEVSEKTTYLPDVLISLEGHPLYETLDSAQRIALGKYEVTQSMFSYAWSEALACMFFNRHLLSLTDNTTAEYRFLLRELIEEYKHQEMFSKSISSLRITPIQPTKLHKFFGMLTVRFFPSDLVFMSVLAIEEIADVYGKLIRQDSNIYPVLRKVSEVHHIEEGRHIHYTKLWLKKYTNNAGLIKRSMYSIIVLLNVYFMRTLYVKKEIFEAIKVPNPSKYTRVAKKHFKKKYAENCLDSVLVFTYQFGGMNLFTKYLWKLLIGRNK